jgi:hypothetical protein
MPFAPSVARRNMSAAALIGAVKIAAGNGDELRLKLGEGLGLALDERLRSIGSQYFCGQPIGQRNPQKPVIYAETQI